jgi:hypothetical protein
VFWNVTSFGFCKNRRFGGTCRLHHQSAKTAGLATKLALNRNRSKLRISLLCASIYRHMCVCVCARARVMLCYSFPARTRPVKAQRHISRSSRPSPKLVIRKASHTVVVTQPRDCWHPNSSFSLPYQSVQHLRRQGSWDGASTGEFCNQCSSATRMAVEAKGQQNCYQ